jgi:hypothetical protein
MGANSNAGVDGANPGSGHGRAVSAHAGANVNAAPSLARHVDAGGAHHGRGCARVQELRAHARGHGVRPDAARAQSPSEHWRAPA